MVWTEEKDKQASLSSIFIDNGFSIFRQPPLISWCLLQSAIACALAFTSVVSFRSHGKVLLQPVLHSQKQSVFLVGVVTFAFPSTIAVLLTNPPIPLFDSLKMFNGKVSQQSRRWRVLERVVLRRSPEVQVAQTGRIVRNCFFALAKTSGVVLFVKPLMDRDWRVGKSDGRHESSLSSRTLDRIGVFVNYEYSD
jgi:hypothetical protein